MCALKARADHFRCDLKSRREGLLDDERVHVHKYSGMCCSSYRLEGRASNISQS